MPAPDRTIWTVGHSTRPIGEFLALLGAWQIAGIAHIRSYPASRRYPQYNRERLSALLAEAGIAYPHLTMLGGRRRPAPDSPHTSWRHPAFRGYANYI